MPMIDIYVPAGTFADPHKGGPRARPRTSCGSSRYPRSDVPGEHGRLRPRAPGAAISDVTGDGRHVRVQVLTNAGALDREKQVAVVDQLTALVGPRPGDPSLARRTWVL